MNFWIQKYFFSVLVKIHFWHTCYPLDLKNKGEGAKVRLKNSKGHLTGEK